MKMDTTYRTDSREVRAHNVAVLYLRPGIMFDHVPALFMLILFVFSIFITELFIREAAKKYPDPGVLVTCIIKYQKTKKIRAVSLYCTNGTK